VRYEVRTKTLPGDRALRLSLVSPSAMDGGKRKRIMTDLAEEFHPKRPVLVWVICIFYFVCIPIGLLSAVAVAVFVASPSIPIPEAQRHYFQSLGYFYYGLKALNYAVVLTWAIFLFQMKRLSLHFLIGSLVLGIVMMIYNYVATDAFALAGATGLIFVAIGWIFNLALLYYNWSLFRKGILR
jgi:hypothetical protein